MLDYLEQYEKDREEFWKQIGECVGYFNLKCPNCDRLRVEHYQGGKDICEKCNWCIQDDEYFINEFF